mgnify:CR=1 FL=1
MLIDTNILIYAINIDSSKHKIAKNFLEKNKTDLEIAHQNILEALRVLTHPKFSKIMDAQEVADAVLSITSVCKLINPTFQTIYIALELIEKYHFKSDQVFDAYLAATALSNNIEIIATDNVKDFVHFEQIQIVNPFTS